MSAITADLSKTQLASRLQRARAEIRAFKEQNNQFIERGIGQLAAAGGGVVAAVARKYLPAIIPGDGVADDASVYLVAGLLDVGAMLAAEGEYADEVNYFAAGFSAYLAGTAVEKILP